MNLIFRLLRIVIHAFFREKIKIFDTSVVTFRVSPFDLDINRHMTNSRYLSVMDLGRMDLIVRTGLFQHLWKHKWGSVLGAATVRWRRGLNMMQKYYLHSHVIGWDEKWIYLDQKVLSNDDVICHAIVKAIFVGDKGSLSAHDVMKHIGVSIESPPLPGAVVSWKKSEECMRQESREFAKRYFSKENNSNNKGNANE